MVKSHVNYFNQNEISLLDNFKKSSEIFCGIWEMLYNCKWESGEKKQTVIEKLKAYLNKFLGTSEDAYYASAKEVAQSSKTVSYIDDKAEKEYLNAAEEEEGNHPVP